MESGKCVRAHYEAMQVAPGALWGKCSELRPGALGSHANALSERTHLVAWMNRSPEKNPIYRFMGISKGVNGLGGSKFIHPMSSFNMYMQVCLGSLTRPGSVLAQTVHIVAASV